VLFSSALFAVGDLVRSIPDTTPGVAPCHSVAILGAIVELKIDGCWMYNIKALNDGRNTLWVPEDRLCHISTSIFDNTYMEPRAGQQSRIEHLTEMSGKWKRRFSELRYENPVLEGEISRLKKAKRSLEKEAASLQSANADLALELGDTMPAAIFWRHTPEGKQALIIRARFKEIVTPLQSKINVCEEKIESLSKICHNLKFDLKKSEHDVVVLKREQRATKSLVKKLSEAVELGTAEVEEEDSENEKKVPEKKFTLEENLKLIKGLLSGISMRQAGENFGCSRAYANKMLQSTGWMQEVINAVFLADCERILQLGQDGGSVAEMLTLCVSVLISDRELDGARHIVLAASTLPSDKTSDATLEAIKYLFERHREKYILFLQFCIDRDVDVSEFSSPDGISLKKMAQGGVGMSDNAAPALLTTELLIDHIREIVEKDFSKDELDAMSTEERDKLVRMLRVGCFPHIRCLLAKWGILEEEAFLKPLIPASDQQLRMEPTLNSLLFAIQKNFRRGHDQYAKGQQAEFFTFVQREYTDKVMFDTGRPGTGSRMDAKFEVAYAVAMNFQPYLDFLIHRASISSTTDPASILSESIKNRLGSLEFYAPLIYRARFWIKLFAPLRVLCNCHDLEDHNLHDMGAAMDQVEEAMNALVQDPALLRDPDFVVFTLQSWPCLKGFYESKKEKVKKESRVADLEKAHLYGCSEDVEDMVDALVVRMATGVLNGLFHNVPNFLTSCDGKYAYDKWEAGMIEETKHCVADNIILAESLIGRVDYIYRRGSRFYMSTASGTASAKHGRLFNNVPSIWKECHTRILI
jgi:hypothetical protein